MALTVVTESPLGIIVTGPGREIMLALLTPAVAQCAIDSATSALRKAIARMENAAQEPPADAVRAYPAFWTLDARADRIAREMASIDRCRLALSQAQAALRQINKRSGK